MDATSEKSIKKRIHSNSGSAFLISKRDGCGISPIKHRPSCSPPTQSKGKIRSSQSRRFEEASERPQTDGCYLLSDTWRRLADLAKSTTLKSR